MHIYLDFHHYHIVGHYTHRSQPEFSSSLNRVRVLRLRSLDYIMASQDMISQFTPDTQSIPPTQPDRSRTPTRQPPGMNHHLPTFRGPLHFATAPFRPGHSANHFPPPPPPTLMTAANQRWMNTHMASPSQQFPPAPPNLRQPMFDPSTFTPPRPTWTPRSPPSSTSPSGQNSVQHGYVGRPIDIPPVEQWKPDQTSTSTTPTR